VTPKPSKQATFEIVAKQLRKPIPAAIDDTLAEKIGFDTLENLRETLEAMRRRRLDGLTRMRLKRDLLDVLAENASFASPEVLVDQEFEQIWKNLEASRANGTMDEDDKLKTDDQLRADYRGIAERRVRLGLLLGEIGRVNTIMVTPEEVTAAIRTEAARYPGREAQMIEFYRNYPAATDALRGPIFEDKVVDYVLDAANVTEAEISIEALERDPEPAAAAGTPEAGTSEAGTSDAGTLEAGTLETEPTPIEAEAGAGEQTPAIASEPGEARTAEPDTAAP